MDYRSRNGVKTEDMNAMKDPLSIVGGGAIV
jgi:hypothetical protein